MNKTTLSVVIVSYNTREVLRNCLLSLKKVMLEVSLEVVVIDNASEDGSSEMVKNNFEGVKLVQNSKNRGFGRANNQARDYAKGEYVLFLNSDTILHPSTLKESVNYLASNKEVGALTCKILLPDGSLDKDARRSFPTPWVSLTHFSGMDRLFPASRYFARYWYGYENNNKVHEVDVLQGAFFLTRKEILDKVGWFDTSYFLDGEDIDLCWKIKESGHNIIYFPKVSITHVKKASKKVKRNLRQILAGINSMEIFYKKRMWDRYPIFINYFVLSGIYLLRFFRTLKFYLLK